MTDVIEALPYICIQDVFILVLDIFKYGFNRILTGPSWSKSIAVWFEFGFPFWFQGQFGQGLTCPFLHGGNAEWSLLILPRLRDIDPSDWLGFGRPSLRVNAFGQVKSLCWGDGLYAIDSRRLLALIVLRDPSYCEQSGRPRLHQELL